MKLTLKKWYADLVTEDDFVFIGYSAKASVSFIPLHYSAALYSSKESVLEDSSFRKGGTPVRVQGSWKWSPRHLKLKGIWTPIVRGEKTTLIENENVTIKWRAMVPMGRVLLEQKENMLKGFGYLEYLELYLKKARLPFIHLKWGRAFIGTDVLCWIEWKGEVNRFFCFYNGKETQAEIVEKDRGTIEITGPFGVWSIEVLRLIRDSDINKFLPRWTWSILGTILFAREQKWLGTAKCRDGITGRAIFETVEWNG